MRKRTSHLARIAAAVTIAAAVLLPAAPAWAGNNGSFAVQPAAAPNSAVARQYFQYTIAAGHTIKDSVSITNLTDATKHFVLYPADGFTTRFDGTLGLRSQTDPRREVGAWVELSRTKLTLPPHGHAEVPFSMAIPAGTGPGDHVGGIVVLDTAITPGNSATGGANIGVRKAIAARVYARVDGPVQAGLSVDRVWLDRSHTPALVRYSLHNTGNVRLGPDVQLTVSGARSGHLLTSDKQLPDDLLPGDEAQYSVPLKSLPHVDRLTMRVVASMDVVSAVGVGHANLLPWWSIAAGVAVALLLLTLAGTGAVRIRRRARAWRVLAAQATEADSEQVSA